MERKCDCPRCKAHENTEREIKERGIRMEQLIKKYINYEKLNRDIKERLKDLTERYDNLSHKERHQISYEINELLEFRRILNEGKIIITK